jgi:hypothetical protein
MIFFRLVVHVTTYWENHRTDTEYEDSLVSVSVGCCAALSLDDAFVCRS